MGPHRKTLKNSAGFSLIEIMIVVGIMGVVAVGAMQFFSQQLRSNNYLEFQARREQLRLVLLSQFLNDPNNCKCLFNGATGSNSFSSNGASTLTQTSPTSIQSYNFATTAPGSCNSATAQAPFVDQTATTATGLQLSSVSIDSITAVTGSFQGSFNVTVTTPKEVLGSKTTQLKIPVVVLGAGNGSTRSFQGCGLQSANNSAVLLNTTINEINNGGGSPCDTGCSGNTNTTIKWTTSCAKRYCVAHGYPGGGVMQEYQCGGSAASSLNNLAVVSCFY